MQIRLIGVSFAAALSLHAAGPVECGFKDYRAQPGVEAKWAGGVLSLQWQGDAGSEMRAAFAVESGQPSIRELAVRKQAGAWSTLGRNLTPEYEVTSGVRRISEQQLAPLRKLGRMDPAYLEAQKWSAFWDAPLNVAADVKRADATYQIGACDVKTDGARLEVTFTGVSMGVFSGALRYTVYKGTNLLRQELIAKTDQPSVAYKYRAGLKGFDTSLAAA